MINKIENIIKEYAKVIGADEQYLPTLNKMRNDGHPGILLVHGVYHYVVQERDVEHKRLIFDKEEELTYEVFKGITFQIAVDFELANRIENQDSRILIFSEQERLMSFLNSTWGEKITNEHTSIINVSPFFNTSEE